ncbi:MAG: hypothetical protein M3143_02235 [Actinomycetota bacterium]|nr:hypothetical protein [Actinomycetota bacterium]
MTVRYAASVVAMAVLPLVACASDETVDDPEVLSPPTVTDQRGIGEQGQGGQPRSASRVGSDSKSK